MREVIAFILIILVTAVLIVLYLEFFIPFDGVLFRIYSLNYGRFVASRVGNGAEFRLQREFALFEERTRF